MAKVEIVSKDGQKTAVEESAIEEFGSGLRGTLLQPDDRDYDEVRQIWNAMIDKRPRIIARCVGVARNDRIHDSSEHLRSTPPALFGKQC